MAFLKQNRSVECRPMWHPWFDPSRPMVRVAFFCRIFNPVSLIVYFKWHSQIQTLSKTWKTKGLLKIFCTPQCRRVVGRMDYMRNVLSTSFWLPSCKIQIRLQCDYWFWKKVIDICVLQGDYGDIEPRKKLRDKLKCKSFEWFLKNIYPELFIPGESYAAGQVKATREC